MTCQKCRHDFCWHCMGDHTEVNACPFRYILLKIIVIVLLYFLNSKLRASFSFYNQYEDIVIDYVLAFILINLYLVSFLIVYRLIKSGIKKLKKKTAIFKQICIFLCFMAVAALIVYFIVWNTSKFKEPFGKLQLWILFFEVFIIVSVSVGYYIFLQIKDSRIYKRIRINEEALYNGEGEDESFSRHTRDSSFELLREFNIQEISVNT